MHDFQFRYQMFICILSHIEQTETGIRFIQNFVTMHIFTLLYPHCAFKSKSGNILRINNESKTTFNETPLFKRVKYFKTLYF